MGASCGWARPGGSTSHPDPLFKETPMRNLTAITGMVLVALVIGTTAPMVMHANAQAGAPAAQNETLSQTTTRRFAPFLRAVVSRRMNVAERIFKVRRSVYGMLEQAETARVLARFVRPDQLAVTLIGGRNLGQGMGVLLFTVVTEEGPVAIKVFHYAFGNDIYISRMDITDDWDEIERFAAMVDVLTQPVTVPLAAQEGE
jgi:hypothetical protein